MFVFVLSCSASVEKGSTLAEDRCVSRTHWGGCFTSFLFPLIDHEGTSHRSASIAIVKIIRSAECFFLKRQTYKLICHVLPDEDSHFSKRDTDGQISADVQEDLLTYMNSNVCLLVWLKKKQTNTGTGKKAKGKIASKCVYLIIYSHVHVHVFTCELIHISKQNTGAFQVLPALCTVFMSCSLKI